MYWDSRQQQGFTKLDFACGGERDWNSFASSSDPKFSHFWNVLSSSGRNHISPTGLTFAIGSHFFLNWTCNSFKELSVKWWNLLLLDNFLGIGVSPSHLPIYSCSSFQPPENTRDNQQNLKKKIDFPSEDSRPDLHQLFSCQTSLM